MRLRISILDYFWNMKEKSQSVNSEFIDGFLSVFEFGSWFKPRPMVEESQNTDYLKSLIKGPAEDAINLRNDWKKILSSEFNQKSKMRGRDGRAQHKNHKNRKSTQ
jgi:hypothetical protein